ncbi:MAG: sigma-54-dependent Fis family transcriptional regulator [Nitrospirae bacterium]|nr:sigma-54-dependent Fis family transcriptional regulator [Nitrospirota bacterium]
MQILIIEDDSAIQLALRVFFEKKNYEVLLADTGAKGLDIAGKNLPDIVLLDLRLPDIYGLELLKKIKSDRPDSMVYIMTAFGEVKDVIDAINLGAENYFQKPVDLEELGAIIDRSSEKIKLRQELMLCKRGLYPIIGRSKAVQGLIHLINLMAENHSTTLLIQGETGTGKELVARNIHSLSMRGENPFVDINCASIPDNILESEIFGYEAGAFTDARSAKKGLLEIADKGTLFLDEIAEMPLATQAKFLRVIETKTFRRLGGTKDIKVDMRIIAATNKDLANAVHNNYFREDLYYRLNVMPITIPPLRERIEDIPLLAEFFITEIAENMAKKIKPLDREAVEALCSYRWPGNIRELRNVLERAMILCRGEVLTVQNLVLSAGSTEENAAALTLKDVERLHIKAILSLAANNRTKAANMLGIARSTLNEKIKSYNIPKSDPEI